MKTPAGWFALYILVLFLLISCDSKPELKQQNQDDATTAVITGYAKYPMRDFKHLKINCDQGRLDVKIYQYKKPYVEVHQTYRKYVNFEERGDSLIIYTAKTPKTTGENPIKKRLRIYVPDLDSYSSEISSTVFKNFRTQRLDIKLDNDYFQLSGCGIKQLAVTTQDACRVVIDNKNVVLLANVRLDEKSYFNCEAPIGKFVLTKKTLENVRLTRVSPKNFKWQQK